MANGVVAERHIVAVGDHGFLALAYGQRDEVVGLALENGRHFRWNRCDHALQIKRVDRDLASDGIADAVRCLGNGREPYNFGGTARDG